MFVVCSIEVSSPAYTHLHHQRPFTLKSSAQYWLHSSCSVQQDSHHRLHTLLDVTSVEYSYIRIMCKLDTHVYNIQTEILFWTPGRKFKIAPLTYASVSPGMPPNDNRVEYGRIGHIRVFKLLNACQLTHDTSGKSQHNVLYTILRLGSSNIFILNTNRTRR